MHHTTLVWREGSVFLIAVSCPTQEKAEQAVQLVRDILDEGHRDRLRISFENLVTFGEPA